MITASAAFDAAIKQSSRLFHARLLETGTGLDVNIRRMTVYKGSCGAVSFTPGAVFSPYIEVTADHYGNVLEDRTLELQIGVMIGGTLQAPVFEYIRIGFFVVGKPKTSTKSTTFTAYGRIEAILAEMQFDFDTQIGSARISDVIGRIKVITGIEIEIEPDIDPSMVLSESFMERAAAGELSCRDALSSVAFVAGGYATETADGKIIIKLYHADVSAEYAAADVMTSPPEFRDYDTVITGVKVTISDDTSYTEGDPVNLKLENSDLTESTFRVFASSLIGLTYRGGEVTLALGDPRLEPWDSMKVIDTDGEIYILPCMSLAFIYDGGLQTRCTAPSVMENDPSSRSLWKVLSEVRKAADTAAEIQARAEAGDFDAVILRVDSTRGIVFKNNWYDTQLRVTIIKGAKIITDLQALQEEFGPGACLRWFFRKQADQEWSQMSASDSHITEGGFAMNVTPDDVDEQITFQCDLIG